MRWERGNRSRNIEDRRGQAPRRRMRLPGGGGAGLRLPSGRRGRGLSLTGLIVMLGIAWLLGINPLQMLMGGGSSIGVGPNAVGFGSAGSAAPPPSPAHTSASEEELVDFISWVLDDVQKTWAQKLPGYQDAKLVLFRDSTPSACGRGQAAMGPFYCPGDNKVYIDLAFYDELRQRFGAPGDFAQAYVLAHEIGHHIQRLTGIEEGVRKQQRSAGKAEANELSVRMELQADCLAGVWAKSTARRGVLESGDVAEGLTAAAAIGDDRIQKMSGRRVQPDSFTHGTAEQRMRWLRRGIEQGDANQCDTFQVSRL